MKPESVMKVSIAMATYNGEAYLQEQLDSFLNQTRLPDEVVISDDHSQDRTLEILLAFKLKAPFEVKIIENDKNKGYKKNFEKVLSQVNGDLIFMSDQDDVWFENKIEKVLKYAADYPKKQVFINDTKITDSTLNPSGRTKMDQIRAVNSDMRTMIMGACSAVRLPFIKICLPIPNYMKGHDDWIHQLAKFCGTRMVIHEPLQYYRIHGKNTSENVFNTTKKISLLNHFFVNIYGTGNSILKLKKKLKYNLKFKEWLLASDTQKLKEFICDYSYPEMIKNLEDETAAIKKRLALYQVKNPGRILKGVKMLMEGDYTYFNGWKSLIKDFFV